MLGIGHRGRIAEGERQAGRQPIDAGDRPGSELDVDRGASGKAAGGEDRRHGHLAIAAAIGHGAGYGGDHEAGAIGGLQHQGAAIGGRAIVVEEGQPGADITAKAAEIVDIGLRHRRRHGIVETQLAITGIGIGGRNIEQPGDAGGQGVPLGSQADGDIAPGLRERAFRGGDPISAARHMEGGEARLIRRKRIADRRRALPVAKERDQRTAGVLAPHFNRGAWLDIARAVDDRCLPACEYHACLLN